MIRIAVLSDVHYSGASEGDETERNLADIFLLRAAHRLNRTIKPDVTVLLGDLIDDATAPDAAKHLQRIRKVAGVVQSPVIVMPGNHDIAGPGDCTGNSDLFWEVFERPPQYFDIAGYRLLPFCDEDMPGYNARRSQADLKRMREARSGFDGKIIALQHVPVFPPGSSECPFNHTNAAEITDVMREAGIDVAISAHYHPGFDVRAGNMTFIAAPALVEAPYRFLEVVIDGDDVRVNTYQLKLPLPGLVDMHVHTQFAYCSENMNIRRIVKLAEMFGLERYLLTEHSGQLMFSSETYWPGDFLEEGSSYQEGVVERTAEYLAAAAEAGVPPVQVGFEVDCDHKGRPVLPPAAPPDSICIGSIHVMRSLRKGPTDVDSACSEMLSLAGKLLKSGIRVLAHPFRIFPRHKLEVPERLFAPLVRMLRDSGVAAEMNTHGNEPPPEFFRMCIDAGVRISLGSDSHNLYEIGELTPHLAILKSIGFDADLSDILYVPDEFRV